MQHPAAAPRCALLAFQALAMFAVATPLRGQNVADTVLVIVGDRVRASAADTTIVGQVTRLTDQGFELGRGEMRRSFAYRDLYRLEVSGGTRSSWIEGTGDELGLFVCVVAGWLVVPWWCFGDFLGKALVGGAIGGVAGAAVGALIRREAWEPVPLGDAGVGFSPILLPQPGLGGRFGLLLGGRLEF